MRLLTDKDYQEIKEKFIEQELIIDELMASLNIIIKKISDKIKLDFKELYQEYKYKPAKELPPIIKDEF